jgi:PPOX class probable F420-dependent enzyme
MSVRMTPDEAWARIDSAHTGIITTLRRDGMPIALPMWFCVVDAAVHFRTLTATKKAARLRHDPRVSFLVEGGERWAELWAVHLAGTAVAVEDEETVARFEATMHDKYSAFRTDRSRMTDDTRAHYERDHVVLRIDAEERIVSWENAKLGLK